MSGRGREGRSPFCVSPSSWRELFLFLPPQLRDKHALGAEGPTVAARRGAMTHDRRAWSKIPELHGAAGGRERSKTFKRAFVERRRPPTPSRPATLPGSCRWFSSLADATHETPRVMRELNVLQVFAFGRPTRARAPGEQTIIQTAPARMKAGHRRESRGAGASAQTRARPAVLIKWGGGALKRGGQEKEERQWARARSGKGEGASEDERGGIVPRRGIGGGYDCRCVSLGGRGQGALRGARRMQWDGPTVAAGGRGRGRSKRQGPGEKGEQDPGQTHAPGAQ